MITVSITWITLLDAFTSALLTVALSTFYGPAAGIDRDGAALNRLGRRLLALHVTGHHFSGHHVVGQHLRQLRLVLRLKKVLNGAGGQLLEGLVGRRKYRERPRALEGVHKTSGLCGSNDGCETPV